MPGPAVINGLDTHAVGAPHFVSPTGLDRPVVAYGMALGTTMRREQLVLAPLLELVYRYKHLARDRFDGLATQKAANDSLLVVSRPRFASVAVLGGPEVALRAASGPQGATLLAFTFFGFAVPLFVTVLPKIRVRKKSEPVQAYFLEYMQRTCGQYG